MSCRLLGLVRGAGLALVLLGTALLCLPQASSADRRATLAESRAMWRVVDDAGTCVHHRGRISTVRTRRFKFGKVTISDNQCGNGRFVLRRLRKGQSRWHIVGTGSDWGNPDRCKDDLKRIPRKVLQDLFYRSICR